MDPGTVVWLPGTGLTDDPCPWYYPGTVACGAEEYNDGTLVYCCPY